MTVVDRFVQAVSHGGAMRPTLQVVHSAETPLRAGYAASIAENWFGRSAPTSAHFMVDPVEIVRMLSDNVVAYAVGPRANGFTLNWEQAGYAHFSRAEWTTGDGMAQMDRLAAGIRERGLSNGIPLRWASDADIRAAARGVPGGICFHDDIRRVLGGTVHTDPMPNYPRDLLMERLLRGSGEDELMGAREDILAAIKAEGDRTRTLVDDGVIARLTKLYNPARLVTAGGKTYLWAGGEFRELGPQRVKAARADGITEIELSELTFAEIRAALGVSDPA